MALQQHSQATDSENFDDNDHHHVEEYIIREHNDKQIGSDETVAWERKVRHLHYIAALLTTCPAGLPVQPQQALPAAQTAHHTRLATQESAFRPARHLRFHSEHAAQTPPRVSRSVAAKNSDSVALHTHTHTPRSSSINSRFTQHMCVPLCCKRHALIPTPARAAPT